MDHRVQPNPADVAAANLYNQFLHVIMVDGYLAAVSRRPDLAAIIREDYHEIFHVDIRDVIRH